MDEGLNHCRHHKVFEPFIISVVLFCDLKQIFFFCSLRSLLPFVYPPAISALNPCEQARAGSQDRGLSHSIIIVRFDERPR